MPQTSSNVMETPAAANEIVITRVFAAPRAMVWGAVADPWQVGQWWGPTGFTTTIQEMDLRAGGKWRLIMHGPDGTDYPNESVFTEVVPMERIELDLSCGREGAPLLRFHKTMTFTDEKAGADGKGAGTRFTIRIAFATAEERDRNVRDYGSIEGGRQTLERLNTYLKERGEHPLEKLAGEAANHELHITRTFNAPRELVWKAWTDPEMRKQWAGSRPFPAVEVQQGAKPGDRWRIRMRGHRPGANPETDKPTDICMGGVMRDIVPPERLVYTYAWEDRRSVGLPDDGKPHETVITIRLEEHDGKTTMHFHQAFFDTAAERDGHNGGWSSSFERLEEFIDAQAAQLQKEAQ
ncbi:MAG: SRPBCC family protein [Acidobacteriaceae bacterium]